MPRYFAFLRAINAGPGRHVKMETLRRAFESLGFTNVSTFIASGNVIFESPEKGVWALERKIETRLAETLGYEVPSLLRTEEELAEIAGFRLFLPPDPDWNLPLNVIFLPEPLSEDLVQKVLAWNSDTNRFLVRGREVYWLRRRDEAGAEVPGVPLERTLGTRITVRGLNTIIRMAEKYLPAE